MSSTAISWSAGMSGARVRLPAGRYVDVYAVARVRIPGR